MAGKLKLIYSETSRKQIKKLYPYLKPIAKAKIERISANPHIGKLLEKELSGYLSFRAKRYRIIYKVEEDTKTIESEDGGLSPFLLLFTILGLTSMSLNLRADLLL